MSFIRSKLFKGKLYFYLVEGYWENGKSRQRVIAYLGQFSTVQAAHAHWQQQLQASDAGARKHAREMVKKLESYL
jgi:hypothetical protein